MTVLGGVLLYLLIGVGCLLATIRLKRRWELREWPKQTIERDWGFWAMIGPLTVLLWPMIMPINVWVTVWTPVRFSARYRP